MKLEEQFNKAVRESKYALNIRRYREKNNLTYEQLAYECGLRFNAIERIEKYLDKPSPEIAKKIEKATGIKYRKV